MSNHFLCVTQAHALMYRPYIEPGDVIYVDGNDRYEKTKKVLKVYLKEMPEERSYMEFWKDYISGDGRFFNPLPIYKDGKHLRYHPFLEAIPQFLQSGSKMASDKETYIQSFEDPTFDYAGGRGSPVGRVELSTYYAMHSSKRDTSDAECVYMQKVSYEESSRWLDRPQDGSFTLVVGNDPVRDERCLKEFSAWIESFGKTYCSTINYKMHPAGSSNEKYLSIMRNFVKVELVDISEMSIVEIPATESVKCFMSPRSNEYFEMCLSGSVLGRDYWIDHG